MLKLVILNLILIGAVSAIAYIARRYARSERAKSLVLIASALFTVLFHYSSLLVAVISGEGFISHLRENENLILPIYPCNVVMWCAVIFAFLKCKKGAFGEYIADYVFWFGLVSNLVGMFLNVDFINNPTLLDFDVTKSIVSHAALLLFVFLLPTFGHVRLNLSRNLMHIIISIVMMLMIGAFCNLVYTVLVSEAEAYDVNSMFLIHSPFEGAEFLTYPVISLIAIPIYFVVMFICELLLHKRGERFYNRKAFGIFERIGGETNE